MRFRCCKQRRERNRISRDAVWTDGSCGDRLAAVLTTSESASVAEASRGERFSGTP